MHLADINRAKLLRQVQDAWAWMGIDFKEIVGINAFGNLLLTTHDEGCYRLCPEELSLERVADSYGQMTKRLKEDEAFKDDWAMRSFLNAAVDAHGHLEEGQCYCLKIPGVLGGAYEMGNVGKISLMELISCSGSLADQIKDLPDGAKIKLVIED